MPTHNLYRISQTVNNDYDTYSDAVVVADSEQEAQLVHPAMVWDHNVSSAEFWRNEKNVSYRSWVEPDYVEVKLIGVAAPDIENNSVICASYHAG